MVRLAIARFSNGLVQQSIIEHIGHEDIYWRISNLFVLAFQLVVTLSGCNSCWIAWSHGCLVTPQPLCIIHIKYVQRDKSIYVMVLDALMAQRKIGAPIFCTENSRFRRRIFCSENLGDSARRSFCLWQRRGSTTIHRLQRIYRIRIASY